MPRVAKKKTTTKTVAEFEPILYDVPAVVSPRAAKRATAADNPARKPSWKHGMLLSQALLLCIMTGIAGYFYYQYRNTPEVAERRATEALVEKVGSLIELPSDEAPTLATVTNKDRLDDQPFFRRAQNGDKILIYQANGRAILYRPSAGKIIDITTVNIEQEAAPVAIRDTPLPTGEAVTESVAVAEAPSEGAVSAPAGESAATPALLLSGVRVALYNGSTKVGVTNAVEASLQGQFPDIEVVMKEKAAKNDYVGYTIISLKEGKEAAAQMLVDALAGTLADLPTGETAPADADVLIIVGSGT